MKYAIMIISLFVSICFSISFYLEGKDKIERLSERIAAITTCLLGGCIVFVICFVAFTLLFGLVSSILGAM